MNRLVTAMQEAAIEARIFWRSLSAQAVYAAAPQAFVWCFGRAERRRYFASLFQRAVEAQQSGD